MERDDDPRVSRPGGSAPLMPDETLRPLRPDVSIRLDNISCPYCKTAFRDDDDIDGDHVIGRRFVPKGALAGWWNLIIRAHRKCNGRKSDLENDISAITMQPDSFGRYADDSELLRAEAERKGKDAISRRTTRPVNQSLERLSFVAPLGPGMTMRGDFRAPPQADEHRVGELAMMHARAFFYLVTYKRDERSGRFWRGPFMRVNVAPRLDWGNTLMRGFMDTVVEWEPRVLGIGASEYFNVAIRKHPTADCWSWAFEWNKNLRAVGFFGDEAAARAIVDRLPRLRVEILAQGPDRWMGKRDEVPLADADDSLFYWSGLTAESA